jgi:DNA repair protein RecO (recombination protein O)
VAPEGRLNGLVLRAGPLGEHDRLITLLSEEEGLIRLAAPGARRPRSRLAAAAPLTDLDLQVVGRRGLRRIRQLRIRHAYGQLGRSLTCLAAAQTLAELALQLAADQDPVPDLLAVMRGHLAQLENPPLRGDPQTVALAVAVKGCVQLLALAGYALPLQSCARSGRPLEPPLGDWSWRCSLICAEGLVIGADPGAARVLNASELALLQRLLRPELPRRRDGELLGPVGAWRHLLDVVTTWAAARLERGLRAAAMLQESLPDGPERS